MRRRFPDARDAPPPPDVQRALDAIVALLGGGSSELDGVALDMEGVPPFHRRVYEVAAASPRARPCHTARWRRASVTRAWPARWGRPSGNPFAIVVPCHRVLAAGGMPGGFSASGGVATKLRMLAIEGARASSQLTLFDGDGAFGFDPGGGASPTRRHTLRGRSVEKNMGSIETAIPDTGPGAASEQGGLSAARSVLTTRAYANTLALPILV